MPKAYFSVQKQQAKLKLAAMDGNSPSAELDSNVPELKPEIQTSKRRKVIEKTVVRVKIGENAGKLKNEGPPSDSWSWRKYGQKPIKGSPHPRGYYRCSTSKGCSAKKQVERCRTDASVLIITYTSSHNHPGPDIHEISLQNQQPTEPQTPPSEDHPTTPKQEDPQEEEKQNQPIIAKSDEDVSEEGHYNFHYLQYPLGISQDIMISQEELDPFSTDQNSEKSGNDTLGNLILDEDPITCSRLQTVTCSAPKSSSSDDQNNDFFDELEELPTTSSAFTSFMRGNYFDERIPVVPS